MGGDILYRWGNPAMYGQGTNDDQVYIAQHDTHWIKSGLNGYGNILAFNNGRKESPVGLKLRPYSTIDEIVPILNGDGCYDRPIGSFAPLALEWTYQADTPTEFFASKISGAHRLENGNTLICSGVEGSFFEVTPSGETVWKYKNPVGENGPVGIGDTPLNNLVFRAYRYPSNYSGFSEKDLTAKGVIELGP